MAQRRLPTDDGYLGLREAIVRGKLAPNQRLVEAEMSTEFGMPRAAVRTALVRLEHEGLVERKAHRGARVRLVPEAEAVEILEARAALEGLAARQAALNLSPARAGELRAILERQRAALAKQDLLGASDVNAELHAKIVALSGHATAQRLIRALNSQMVRFQFPDDPDSGASDPVDRGAHGDRRRAHEWPAGGGRASHAVAPQPGGEGAARLAQGVPAGATS